MSDRATLMWYDNGLMAIFAREVIEASIVVGQYRNVVKNSPQWSEPAKQRRGLRLITRALLLATLVAVLIILAVAIPVILRSQGMSKKTEKLTEGISKLVACVCLFDFSLKVPKLMNAYSIEERSAEDFELTESNIIFNVAWNVFREVMECGFFMIPFFVGKNAQAIPASAAIGIASASIFGTIIHVITEKWRGSRSWLAVFVAWLIGQLSAGLFQSGCHNFEFVYGSTPVVYKIENERLADNRLPMLLIGPFGYSSTRTVLQIVAFWSWCFLLCFGHYFKHRATIKKMNEKNTPISSTDDQDDLLEVGIEENLDSDSESLPVQDNIAQT